MKDRLSTRSLALKLTAVTIGVFAFMLLFSNYMLWKEQSRMAEKLASQLEHSFYGMEGGDDAEDTPLTLVVDEAQIRTLAEYRIYAAFIMGITMLGGALLFVLVIRRMLRPLRLLTEKVNEIDIDNVEYVKDEIRIEKGSYEIRALSEGFQAAINKIYENYEKQRQFSINAAHELRTPLAVLKTKIDVFRKKERSPSGELADFVDSMEKNITRLSGLVEGILFLTRDEKPERKEVFVRELAEEVILDLEEKASEKEISLHVTGDDAVFYTDDLLLERAIYNLVDNAIKYNTPGGSCELRVRRERGLEIDVTDSGIGMSDEEKSHAFDLFYRADISRSQRNSGYGIGLALVRDIVQKLGGGIRVLDNPSGGCIFRMSFPPQGSEAEITRSRQQRQKRR